MKLKSTVDGVVPGPALAKLAPTQAVMGRPVGAGGRKWFKMESNGEFQRGSMRGQAVPTPGRPAEALADTWSAAM